MGVMVSVISAHETHSGMAPNWPEAEKSTTPDSPVGDVQHGVQEGGDEAETGRVGGGWSLGHLRQAERQPRVDLRVAELTRQRQTVIGSAKGDRRPGQLNLSVSARRL